jgi:two-component system sensor histidine kinase RegB
MAHADVITGGEDRGGYLRLQTLVRLRWLAVVGQSLAVLFTHFWLGFHLLLGPCLGVIAISAWLNIFLSLRWRTSQRLGANAAGLLLGYDILQLALLLYLTGGLQNPFAFLFLVPVTVSAASLPLNWTLGLSVLALVCASILGIHHFPLPWSSEGPPNLPRTFIAGLWAALCCGVMFAALYVRRIAEEARQMSSALTATELVLAREQRLSALDGMAAAAAHELGTPLATITLVAKEMKREAQRFPSLGEDIDLLVSQTARCREILSRLANRDAQKDSVYLHVSLPAMIEDLVSPLRGPDVTILIDAAPAANAPSSPEPVFLRNPGIAYGLGNLIENAIDFAARDVSIRARWNATQIEITLTDDGPGFDPTILERLGDPFVTSRPGYGAGQDPEEGQHAGMGLGFFIAKTLLERSGAAVALANRPEPEHGALIKVTWPRATVDVGKTS